MMLPFHAYSVKRLITATNPDLIVIDSSILTPASSEPRRSYKYRDKDDRAGADMLLIDWRAATVHALYGRRPWGVLVFLPQAMVERFAKRVDLTSVDDLIAAGWSSTHANRHGAEIISMLQEYDNKCEEKRENNRKRQAEVRAEETVKRQRIAEEKKAQKKADKAAKPKAPRAVLSTSDTSFPHVYIHAPLLYTHPLPWPTGYPSPTPISLYSIYTIQSEYPHPHPIFISTILSLPIFLLPNHSNVHAARKLPHSPY
ncbi:hypothetical protein C8F01DRAFT_1258378 [Mycena amicta]|nr:hypothetical protein C8F01DRAFT_1258378 [Mycena amicta]